MPDAGRADLGSPDMDISVLLHTRALCDEHCDKGVSGFTARPFYAKRGESAATTTSILICYYIAELCDFIVKEIGGEEGRD